MATRNFSASRGRSSSLSHCFVCKGLDHFPRDCPSWESFTPAPVVPIPRYSLTPPVSFSGAPQPIFPHRSRPSPQFASQVASTSGYRGRQQDTPTLRRRAPNPPNDSAPVSPPLGTGGPTRC
ncbi:hypothetical protein J437_LFUL017662 [Ladona fulva]|uniref:CCHC-type domain-containing protein n=1 Tax=Ladona fulva TaxID=123851 RepID=A0A8K0PAB0_LADFU|nr:hypothetical protein J437_LFUL017662 [Ladona fulva]